MLLTPSARRTAVTLLLAAPILAGDTSRPPVTIKPEPLSVSPGKPLSQRTLVQKPPILKDAVTWTIETRRHRGPLFGSALSKDGKRLATGGIDGIVRLWDAATGEFVRALVGHDSYVYSLDWSPDGKTLASAGSFDGTVRLWDAATGMPLRVLRGHKGYVYRVAWSPDGRSVAAAGGTSGFVTLWDVDKVRAVRTIETGNAIAALAWGPDSRKLSVAGVEISVRVWDMRDGQPGRTFEVPGRSATAAAWSPDGKTLIGSGGGKTFAWTADTGKSLHEWNHSSQALVFATNGALAASTEAQVLVWQRGLDKEPAVVAQHWASSIAFAPDGSLFAGSYVTVAHWKPDGPKPVRVIDAAGSLSIQYTPGRPLVTGPGESAVSLWNLATGQRIARLEGHTAGVAAAAWSADGKLLATASGDKTVRLWDAGGKPVRTLTGHEGPVSCVAWADGRTLASGSADKTVRLWQATSDGGKVLWRHDNAVLSLAWSRGGKQLASGADEATVKIGTPAGGKSPRDVASEPARSLAWAPNGKLLAAGATTGGLRLLNAANGKVQQEWPASGSPPEITGLAWSPDGTTLLAGRANYTTDVVRTGAAKPLLTLNGMAAPTAVAWSPGGTTALVAEAGRSVRAYDLPGGALRATVVVEAEQLVTVSALGHYRAADEATSGLVYVVQTARGQDTYDPKAFAAKFRFKNNPAAVRLSGK
jgi:WD40 repeat protein